MIHSVRFKCVLDTNVIYPIEIRDLLFWFAHFDMYTPKWSEHIFDEWKDVMIRNGISEEEASKRVERANIAFPDALVANYSGLINSLELPDPKDRHVLAAAIKTNANVIVTNNIKHFPKDYLASFGLTAKTADDFLTDIVSAKSGEFAQRRMSDLSHYHCFTNSTLRFLALFSAALLSTNGFDDP